jgi:hypothetical protein
VNQEVNKEAVEALESTLLCLVIVSSYDRVKCWSSWVQHRGAYIEGTSSRFQAWVSCAGHHRAACLFLSAAMKFVNAYRAVVNLLLIRIRNCSTPWIVIEVGKSSKCSEILTLTKQQRWGRTSCVLLALFRSIWEANRLAKSNASLPCMDGCMSIRPL